MPDGPSIALGCALVGAMAVVSLIPFGPAYPSVAGVAAVNIAAAFGLAHIAQLLRRREALLPDLLASGSAVSLAVLALATGLIAVGEDAGPGTFSLAAPAVGRMAAALGLVAAALVAPRPTRASAPLVATAFLVTAGAGGLVASGLAETLALRHGTVGLGDVLLLASIVVLLGAVVRDNESQARDAVARERRRLARELHDGLAQELAYLAGRSRHAKTHPEQAIAELAAAVERALEESRLQIQALTRPPDEPLATTVERAARSVAARTGLDVRVEAPRGIEAPPEVRESLLRVIAEATRNASHHGRARSLHVGLRRGAGLVLTIADDGHGFDPSRPRRPDALGLVGMEERVRAHGGELRVDSAPGAGTRIEVRLP